MNRFVTFPVSRDPDGDHFVSVNPDQVAAVWFTAGRSETRISLSSGDDIIVLAPAPHVIRRLTTAIEEVARLADAEGGVS